MTCSRVPAVARQCALTLLILVLPLSQPLPAQYATGLEFTNPATYLNVPLGSTPLMGLLPRSADLSRLLPPPGDQGAQSSCVGWAVAYAMKTYHEAVERRWPVDQPSSQFSPAFVYNQIRKSQDCSGGTMFVDALNLLRRAGAAPLSDFPYLGQDCRVLPDAGVKRKALRFAIADWRRVRTDDQAEVKAYVAAGIPVLIGMMVDQPFMQLAGPAVYARFSGNSLGGHAMLVVGYDDARAAFRVINSWGQTWGDGGFAWISYGAFRQAVREGYVTRDISPVALGVAFQDVAEPVLRPPKPATAQVSVVEVAHGVAIARGAELPSEPGMSIVVRATVLDGVGQTAQLVVRFARADQTFLDANPESSRYRDARGLVAGATTPVRVTASPFSLSRTMTLPYSAFNAASARRTGETDIHAVATIYLDNFEVAQSVSKLPMTRGTRDRE